MRVHTQGFKDQIKKMGREINSRITYGNNVLTSEKLYGIYPIVNGSLLKSAMKELQFESSIQVPNNTLIKYEFGLKVDSEYEYLDYGVYIVYSSEFNEDTKTYKHTCYDGMLFSMKEYKNLQNGTFPMTIREYITNLCLDCNLIFKNFNDEFPNYDKIIESDLYANLDYTYRDIFDELSAVTASTICLNSSEQVEVRYVTETNDTIDTEYLKDVNVKFGAKYGPINSIVLSRSGESDNVFLRDEYSIKNNGICELKIIDNQIMNFNNRSEYLTDILAKLNGLEYFLNDYSSTGILYYEMLDKYNIKIDDKTYSCILFNDEPEITQGIVENIFTEIPEETTTDYMKADKTDRKINQTYLIVDKQNQTIQSVVSQTNEQNQKIAQVTQTVEELNSKISDIADITTSQENNNGKVSFEKINESEPIRIVVRPIGENISYLYPSDNLFPSDDLYLKDRTIRFNNITTNEIFDYELPDDLLYYDSENYDEFILDYDGQSCVINKRVGYNADGTTYVLDNSTTIEYPYPKIELKDGNYEIELLGYDNTYLFARLMAQNIYTTQFATRAEVNSKISQTATSITEEVTGKLDTLDKEVNAKLELKVNMKDLISEINASADVISLKSNRLIIDSNNFKLTADGKITSTSGQIGGYSIGEKSLFANIKDKYTYTLDDYERTRNILMGQITPTDEDYERLDLNKDGAINSADLVRISRKRNGLESTEGTVSINTEDANNTIVFEGNTNNIHTSIGMNKITTDIFTSRNISTETLSIGGQSMPKIMSGTSLPSEVTNGAIFLLYE